MALQPSNHQANYSNVNGAALTLFAMSANGQDYEETGVDLCGIDSISFSAGSAGSKTDITDFCWGLKGFKREIVGLQENGTLSLNAIIFDPFQAGQKFLHDLAINAQCKLEMQFAYNEEKQVVKATYFLQKAQGGSHEIKVGTQWQGKWDLQTTAEPIFEVIA